MHKHLSKVFLAKSDKSTRKYRSFSEIDDKLSNYNFGFGLRNRTWMTGKQQSNETKWYENSSFIYDREFTIAIHDKNAVVVVVRKNVLFT